MVCCFALQFFISALDLGYHRLVDKRSFLGVDKVWYHKVNTFSNRKAVDIKCQFPSCFLYRRSRGSANGYCLCLISKVYFYIFHIGNKPVRNYILNNNIIDGKEFIFVGYFECIGKVAFIGYPAGGFGCSCFRYRRFMDFGFRIFNLNLGIGFFRLRVFIIRFLCINDGFICRTFCHIFCVCRRFHHHIGSHHLFSVKDEVFSVFVF